MKVAGLIAMGLGFAVCAATAQDSPQICAAISDDSKRLECFDLIFRKSAATLPSKGDWAVTEETSKIDDSKNVTLALDSIEPIRNQYGQEGRMHLLILCREKKTDFYITFAGHFMADIESWGTVTYRLDKRPAVKRHFAESTDHQALGLWGAASIPFIKEMFGASRLFVRATPYNASAVTAEFNIIGLQDAIKPLRKACGWVEPPSVKRAPVNTPSAGKREPN